MGLGTDAAAGRRRPVAWLRVAGATAAGASVATYNRLRR